jgi:hypothetical protein
MSPLTIQVLKRFSVYAIVLAALLLAVPRVLDNFGLWGPDISEQVAVAERAVAAARAYGAEDGQPALRAALETLTRAQLLAHKGDRLGAHRAAQQALAQAIDAQRLALAEGEQTRRHAAAVVDGIDGLLNALDDLYREATPGLTHERSAELLSTMRSARQAGAGLVLTYEQRNYRKVVADEAAVRTTLAEARAQLEAARKRPTTP